MDNWFTVEQIDRQTFAISEYRHWEETHCYLLCGDTKALLIDTGLGVSDIKKITDELTPLPVTVVTTHAHWDHIGGHRYFDDIAVHELEKGWLADRFPLPLEAVRSNLLKPPCEISPLTLIPTVIGSFAASRGVFCTARTCWIWAGGSLR